MKKDRTERVELTNMCMIYKGSKILVQERIDPDWPGVTFPGGHVEEGESFVESTIREVYEETGLKVSDLKLCGIKQWVSFKDNVRYMVLFYKTENFSGEIKPSDEGKVFWIERSDLEKYKLAYGFSEMMEVFEKESLSENYITFENGEWKRRNL